MLGKALMCLVSDFGMLNHNNNSAKLLAHLHYFEAKCAHAESQHS